MENILNRMIDIENKAQQIVSQAGQAKQDMPEQVKRILHDFQAQMEKTSAQGYEERLASENARLQKALQSLSEKCQSDMDRLQRAYERHGQEWVDKLYESVTGHEGL